MINAIADFFQNLFGPVVSILGAVLLYFHDSLGAPWWLSIVLLTVIVRALLFPLTVKQVRGMRAVQALKPDMDRIRAQYRNNTVKQREEMAKLYQERQVNPLAGCLPILIQMPIFIGIFYVIRQFGGTPGRTAPKYESFKEGGILWFQDLSHADPYYLLPVLSALTMLAATEITSKQMEPQQRWLMRLLPLGFTAFLLTFPAGLFVYWITSNLVTFAQNYFIYNHGPGKGTPNVVKTANRRTKSSSGRESGAGGRERESLQQPYQEQKPRSTTNDPAAHSAKVAKRKRRKKKK